MVALRVESLPLPIGPLCTASMPSKVVDCSPLQPMAPEVDHVALLLSRASARETTCLTERSAFELVIEPKSFWTTQLYWPASESRTLEIVSVAFVPPGIATG